MTLDIIMYVSFTKYDDYDDIIYVINFMAILYNM